MRDTGLMINFGKMYMTGISLVLCREMRFVCNRMLENVRRGRIKSISELIDDMSDKCGVTIVLAQ